MNIHLNELGNGNGLLSEHVILLSRSKFKETVQVIRCTV